jgi:GTPase SAR1 family protein
VYDTSGRQGFRRINANYLRAFEAVVFVYDVTRESTLTALKEFIQEPMTQASLSSNRGAVILVGSKSDVAANERQVQLHFHLLTVTHIPIIPIREGKC